MLSVLFDPDRVIRGRTPGDSFSVQVSRKNVEVSRRQGPVLDSGDVRIETFYTGGQMQGAEITYTNNSGSPLEFTLSNPSVAEIEGNLVIPAFAVGQMQGVTDVLASNGVESCNYGSVSVIGSRSHLPGDVVSFSPDSLIKHLYDGASALVYGKSPDSSFLDLYTSATYSLTAPAAVQNPAALIPASKFAASSFCRNTQNWETDAVSTIWHFPAHLVSERHAIISSHILGKSIVGKQFVFRRPDGTFQNVAVQSVATIRKTGFPASDVDLSLLYFTEAVADVVPYSVLPSDLYQWLPGTDSRVRSAARPLIPIISKYAHTPFAPYSYRNNLSINNTADTAFTAGGFPSEYGFGDWPSWIAGAGSEFKGWGRYAIGGDSGSASFLCINESLVLLGLTWTSSSGPAIHHFTDEINTAMNTLAGTAQGTYAMRTVDLSGFTKFG